MDSFVSDISPDGELETAGEGCKYPHRSQGRVVLTWTHGGNFTPLLDNTAGPNIAPYNISSYCRKSTKSWVHKIQNLDTMRTLDTIDLRYFKPRAQWAHWCPCDELCHVVTFYNISQIMSLFLLLPRTVLDKLWWWDDVQVWVVLTLGTLCQKYVTIF